ncbi:MAG: tetratricopeptide repeat protein [bacterium]|nr:tetratricopeptide repeat protein [bacterium]
MKQDKKHYFTIRGRLFLASIILIVFGFTRLEEGRYVGPIEIYEARLNKAPNDPKAILNLADAYCNKALHLTSTEETKQLLDGAILLYEKALSKKKDPKTFYSLGQAYFKIAKFSDEKDSLYKKAEDSFISSEKGGLKKKEMFLYLGHILLLRGALDDALSYYKKALDFSPRDPIILYNLGFCYYEKGDFDTAFLHLQRIGKRSLPKDIEINIHLLLAKIYEKKEDLVLAEGEYRKVLSKEKTNFDAKEALNRILLSKNP